MNEFKEQFQKSRSFAEEDKEIIRRFFHSTDEVVQAPDELDKRGADYIVTIYNRNSSPIYVDVKRREGNDYVKYWKNGEPELALETYSIIAEDGNNKYGWTVDWHKITDYVLYVFPDDVCTKRWMFPYQQLKSAFVTHFNEWKNMGYSIKREKNNGYTSEAMFVPVSAVIKAINECMVMDKDTVWFKKINKTGG